MWWWRRCVDCRNDSGRWRRKRRSAACEIEIIITVMPPPSRWWLCLSRNLCKLKITPKLRSFVICPVTTQFPVARFPPPLAPSTSSWSFSSFRRKIAVIIIISTPVFIIRSVAFIMSSNKSFWAFIIRTHTHIHVFTAHTYRTASDKKQTYVVTHTHTYSLLCSFYCAPRIWIYQVNFTAVKTRHWCLYKTCFYFPPRRRWATISRLLFYVYIRDSARFSYHTLLNVFEIFRHHFKKSIRAIFNTLICKYYIHSWRILEVLNKLFSNPTLCKRNIYIRTDNKTNQVKYNLSIVLKAYLFNSS